jgi:hypothetical protein
MEQLSECPLHPTTPKMKRVSLLLLTLFAGSSLLAQIPETLSYQSYMTDSNGVPVDTTVGMTFALFDVDEGGEALWTESQDAVVVSGGVLSTTLGQVESLFGIVFDRPLWLEATFDVNGQRAAEGPRMPLDAVPYSMGTRGMRFDRGFLNLVEGYSGNSIETGASIATISGGGTLNGRNEIGASGVAATIGGGYSNFVEGENATISGGFGNQAHGLGATVPGGHENQATGEHSFAAGYRARAEHPGSFAWSGFEIDGSEPFVTTNAQQFLIRARGGVGIGTNTPQGALHVDAGSNDVPDLVVGGFNGVDSDGMIHSDPRDASSSILLNANGGVAIQLDADNNTSEAFTIADGGGSVIFQVLEAGAVVVKSLASEGQVRVPMVRLDKSLGEGGKGTIGDLYIDNIVYAWAAVEFNGAASASYSCTVERTGVGQYLITPFTALGEGISATVTPQTGKVPVLASVQTSRGTIQVTTLAITNTQNGLSVIAADAPFYIQIVGRP